MKRKDKLIILISFVYLIIILAIASYVRGEIPIIRTGVGDLGFGDIFVNESGDTMTGVLTILGTDSQILMSNSKMPNITMVDDSGKGYIQYEQSGVLRRFVFKPEVTYHPQFLIQADDYIGTEDLYFLAYNSVASSNFIFEQLAGEDFYIQTRNPATGGDIIFRPNETEALRLTGDGDAYTSNNFRVGASTGERITLDGDDLFVLGNLEAGNILYLSNSSNANGITCNNVNQGGVFFNTSINKPCYCNSSDWVRFSDDNFC